MSESGCLEIPFLSDEDATAMVLIESQRDLEVPHVALKALEGRRLVFGPITPIERRSGRWARYRSPWQLTALGTIALERYRRGEQPEEWSDSGVVVGFRFPDPEISFATDGVESFGL